LDTNAANPPLARAFRIAYVLGLFICVAWPLALQLMLGTAIQPGSAPPGGVVAQLGYTFTGLTLGSALFVTWRWGRVRKQFAAMPQEGRPGLVLRETILYAALFELSSLYGLIYYALGGVAAERYSRSFIALTTVMFFVFVPRFQAWRDAAQEEQP
jgi:hypothetical protein